MKIQAKTQATKKYVLRKGTSHERGPQLIDESGTVGPKNGTVGPKNGIVGPTVTFADIVRNDKI